MRKFWKHIENKYPSKYRLFIDWLNKRPFIKMVYKYLPVQYQFGVFIEFVSACEYENRYHGLPNKLNISLKMEFEVNSGSSPFIDIVKEQIDNWFSMSSYIDKELIKEPDMIKLTNTELMQNIKEREKAFPERLNEGQMEPYTP